MNRTTLLKINSAVIVLCQLLGMLISFLMVPLVISYLGVQNYGIWVTLWGLLEWFNVFDIGLGHGLRNMYTTAKSMNDISAIKVYVSTTFYILMLIGIILFVILFICGITLRWDLILNSKLIPLSELRYLIVFFSMYFCVKFIINIVGVLLTADQLPFIPSSINLIANIFSLIGILCIKKYCESSSILLLGIIFTTTQLFPFLISYFILVINRYKNILPNYKLYSNSTAKSVLSLGSRYFFIQITSMLLFAFNNIVISNTCGPSDVTKYSVAYKYMSILYLIFMAILSPLWSATTEAYAKGDSLWIKQIYKKMNVLWALFIFVGFIMILISQLVYAYWLNNELKPDYLLLSLLFVYMILWMRYTLYRTFMNAIAKIKMQLIITTMEGLLHIPIIYISSLYFNIYGVVIVMIIWSLINSVWEPIQFNKLINNKAHGIWNK
ncbi:MAG: lipopolysaccharide biosynthesis protein [Tannerellaceae bacterium]